MSKQLKNKNLYIVIGAAILLLVVGTVGYFVFANNKPEAPVADQKTKKKKVSAQVNVIPVEQRPYLYIDPAASAREVTVGISDVKKEATELEYELEYQSGSLLQGAFGAIELGTLPASEKVLLGSCSAGGACTYHQDVKGGTLLTQYRGPEEYALKSDWKFYESTKTATELTSRDEKFNLTSKELASLGVAVVFNNAGYPAGLTGKAISDPFTVKASGAQAIKEATVKITVEQAAGNLSIMGWDGSKWQSMETTVTGNQVAATGALMETYIVVSQ